MELFIEINGYEYLLARGVVARRLFKDFLDVCYDSEYCEEGWGESLAVRDEFVLKLVKR